jgi:thiol-disulfide isomerase/thioredoxin
MLAGALPALLLSLPAQHLSLCDEAYASVLPASSQRQLQPHPGHARPALVLPDLNDTRQDLGDRAGKVVLVHFFATWCEPCREELASLNRLIATQPHDAISVLAVNVAEVPARVRRFLEDSPVHFPVLVDTDRAATKAWGVSVLPTTFVLDRNLVARLFVEGDIDWLRPDVLAALERVGTTAAR